MSRRDKELAMVSTFFFPERYSNVTLYSSSTKS
jgi:hypothetical protein